MNRIFPLQGLARLGAIASACFLIMMACGHASAADDKGTSNAELAAKFALLEAQNKLLMERVGQLERQVAQVQERSSVQQQPTSSLQQDRSSALANAGSSSDQPATVFSSYGEIGYTRPTKSLPDTNFDVQRVVLGMQHRFDEKTKVVTELEWEHAIVSSDDAGEAEVEQVWVEREFQPNLRGRAGLFLMPVGLINPNHEPTAYYGVFRPDVDRKIVPSTWREVGLGLSGDTNSGLNWDVAVTTAPNLSKWDPTSTEGLVRGPLQATHGEGQFAAARNFGVVGALSWRGTPGLSLGTSLVYDSIGQGQQDFLGNGSRLMLLDVHGRYQISRWDFAGEYVRATISDLNALNASFLASTPDATLVPKLFYGGYVQAAYSLLQAGDYSLSPFVRYEVLNTGADFGSLAPDQPDEKIWTLGFNLRIGEGVVLKADYRRYRENTLPDPDHFNLGTSFNLGVGFSY